jgi:predicted  nucleic acid-binding Zn-ribbon protein
VKASPEVTIARTPSDRRSPQHQPTVASRAEIEALKADLESYADHVKRLESTVHALRSEVDQLREKIRS